MGARDGDAVRCPVRVFAAFVVDAGRRIHRTERLGYAIDRCLKGFLRADERFAAFPDRCRAVVGIAPVFGVGVERLTAPGVSNRVCRSQFAFGRERNPAIIHVEPAHRISAQRLFFDKERVGRDVHGLETVRHRPVGRMEPFAAMDDAGHSFYRHRTVEINARSRRPACGLVRTDIDGPACRNRHAIHVMVRVAFRKGDA